PRPDPDPSRCRLARPRPRQTLRDRKPPSRSRGGRHDGERPARRRTLFPMSARAAAILFAFLLFPGLAARAQEESVEAKARKLLEQYKGSLVVVTAKGVLKAKTTGDPLPARDLPRRTLGVTI